MEKTYKSVDEQITYLKENKKIIVKDEQKYIFRERNYSSLINPYKEFFSNGRDNNGNHIYKNEVDFQEILKLVKVDEEFCTIMYSYIGTFEKKFKTVLFNEICNKYIGCENEDVTCTCYVKEIDEFLSSNDVSKLPRFCMNYPYMLSKKGYIEDSYDTIKKNNLLQHLKELGTGLNEEGKLIEKSNRLIDHYLKTQTIAPLWILPNALTLGELNILFSMLDSESQKRIVSKFYNTDEIDKISINKISSFSGSLEIIRRIRNVVNHYEPIFPLLVSELKPIKKIQDSKIYSVLKLLEESYVKSHTNSMIQINLNLETNNFNSKYIKILDVMKEFTK